MNLKKRVNSWINSQRYLHYFILGLASISYIVQTWTYSRLHKSLLDEGNFLLKGYLFATGEYIPYQDYGTWTNKMPLSFLIPGYMQKAFGTGLHAGRIYIFVLSLLILIVAVILGNRFGGKWGGALVASMLMLNPAPLKMFSWISTEQIVALFILLTMLLVLGKERPLWQICLGSFFAGMIPLTRINFFLVLPLVIVYIFWEHGFKRGIYGLLVSMVPFIGLHVIYWPGILQIWASWIPDGFILSLDVWKHNFGDALRLHQPDPTILQRILAISQGISYLFPSIFGLFSVFCLMPKKLLDRNRQRIVIFLIALFSILFIFHLGASIFFDFNIHAFFRYITTFHFLGIFLVTMTWRDWNLEQPTWKKWIIGFGIGFFTLLIGYSISEESSYFGGWVKNLLQQTAQVFEGGKIEILLRSWWELLQSRFGWEFSNLRTITAVLLIIIFVMIILIGSLLLYNRFLRKRTDETAKSLLPYTMVVFLVFGTLLAPTEILGGGYDFYDCQFGVIQTYQEAIDKISDYVEPEDQVFWVGKDTQVVLLGLYVEKDIQIYPQQLNSIHSFRLGGDVDRLTKFGFWNDTLAQEWIDESNVLLFEKQALSGWFSTIYPQLDLSEFEKIGKTSVLECAAEQKLTIYSRK